MRAPTRNPFVSAGLRRAFDTAVMAYDTRHRDLFLPDGQSPRRASTFASWFWHGYSGTVRNWDQASRHTFGYAWYRAGQFVKQRGYVPPTPPV